MKTEIKWYRLVLNILFYIFYVLLASLAFSFIFPSVLVVFWKTVLDPNNPIFANIQVWILIVVLFVSLILRKYFYLPIVYTIEDTKPKKRRVSYSIKTQVKKEVPMMKKVSSNTLKQDKKSGWLDIKIGKEIK